MMIQIGGQYGDPRADDLFWPLQKKLNECFDKYLIGVYFNTLMMFSVVFRVSGKVRDFGSEGPERMKFIKKDYEITIDLVFTEASWRGVDKGILKQSVANGIQECLSMMLDKAAALNEINNLDAFNTDVEKAISEFLDN